MAGTANVKMFRGVSAMVWMASLQRAGWPEAAACRMSLFLVDGGVIPTWEELQPKPADPASSAAALPPSQ